MAKEEIKHSVLSIKERNVIMLDGVINVSGFDEGYVTLETSDGRITIEGVGLKIESLCRDGGVIEIRGRIDGVFYAKEKKGGSRFSRLFGC